MKENDLVKNTSISSLSHNFLVIVKKKNQTNKNGWLVGHLEKEMAIHFRILAWKISWTEESSELQSMGSQRVGYDWATNIYLLRGPLLVLKCVLNGMASSG